jgi:predicted ArsR family transcriptional regulator
MEGMTITEMAKRLKIPPRTVERRIQRAGIKPLTKEALYPLDTFDKIKEVKMGRPPKAKPEEATRSKPAKKKG